MFGRISRVEAFFDAGIRPQDHPACERDGRGRSNRYVWRDRDGNWSLHLPVVPKRDSHTWRNFQHLLDFRNFGGTVGNGLYGCCDECVGERDERSGDADGDESGSAIGEEHCAE